MVLFGIFFWPKHILKGVKYYYRQSTHEAYTAGASLTLAIPLCHAQKQPHSQRCVFDLWEVRFTVYTNTGSLLQHLCTLLAMSWLSNLPMLWNL